jgi:curved DNA-binding protein CbpA
MRFSECFTVLNVHPDSKWEEVRKSYHFLAKKYHPDLHPNKPSMTSKFRKISEAFNTLEIRYKLRSKKSSPWKTINEQRNRFTRNQNEANSGDPQVATPLGKAPTPLKAAGKNHSKENAERGFKGLGDTLFDWEKKLFLLDIRKNIFLKKRLPSHSNIVRVKKGDESFQVRIPPGPWTSMFIRVPDKGNKSMFSNKRGDLLLNINVPNSEAIDPAPAVYYYKVRIPENAIGTNKVWTLKSATGPIKFTLPKTAQNGQKLILKANRSSIGPKCASHIMTLNLVKNVEPAIPQIDTFA